VTDAELAGRAARGDGEAFGQLVERHALVARRIARAALLDPHDADDAVQDATFSAWRHLDQYDGARPFAPWFLRIVVNAAADLRRRRAVRRVDQVSEAIPDPGPSPELSTDRALLRERLDVALRTLPERHRIAVVMHDAEGFGHAEIAGMLGVPEGTIRSDVFHARRALRAVLGTSEERT
jgi:RNA polymerase sigma-70 factor (ECF subfamily)